MGPNIRTTEAQPKKTGSYKKRAYIQFMKSSLVSNNILYYFILFPPIFTSPLIIRDTRVKVLRSAFENRVK